MHINRVYARAIRWAALAGTVVFALTACSGMGRINYGKLIISGRDGWQHPERVVEALELSSGDVVVDIGAGDGYFVQWFSRAVGPEGRVYAVEVDPDQLRVLSELIADEGLMNVELIHGTFDDPKLPDREVDVIFTCNTYHHIEGRPAYFGRLVERLRNGGRVAHIDHRDNVSGVLRLFQSKGHWTNVDQMRREMAEAGYRYVASFDFLPLQSYVLFVPDRAHRESFFRSDPSLEERSTQ